MTFPDALRAAQAAADRARSITLAETGDGCAADGDAAAAYEAVMERYAYTEED